GGVRAAPRAEHQRELGQGGAARADARAGRHQRHVAAAAPARHERGSERRHRPRPRSAAFPDRVALRERRSNPATMPSQPPPGATNRLAITACIILATLMQALDTTIANVALPYMQGSVSASQDEIAWVLTSYIVAAAI